MKMTSSLSNPHNPEPINFLSHHYSTPALCLSSAHNRHLLALPIPSLFLYCKPKTFKIKNLGLRFSTSRAVSGGGVTLFWVVLGFDLKKQKEEMKAKCLLFSLLICKILFLSRPHSASADESASCKFTVTPSGLAYCDEVVGYGPEAVKGHLIKAHHVGKLEDGKVFSGTLSSSMTTPCH